MSSDRPRYRTFVFDSGRWDGFSFRTGDIVISTPPKCGTTWMQMICALLIFQTPELDRPLTDLSPWLDMLTQRQADVADLLVAQGHRRFIKTHTPLDGLPMDDRVTYICVGRDPRDAAISMYNHFLNMDVGAFVELMQKVAVADGLDQPTVPDGFPPNAEAFFWHWVADPTPATETGSSLLSDLHHYDVALRASREMPNVAVLHYSDLKADCGGQMRRLARKLDIDVPEALWPVLVEAASFESMRGRAGELAPNSTQKVWKEPQRFFHSGTGGHWREFFNAAAKERYESRVAALASPDVAAWAHAAGQQ
jgi:hypothetical protein